MTPYPIVSVGSGDDRASRADVTGLGSCSAPGEAPEAAPREIRAPLDLRLEAARQHGISLPRSGRAAAISQPAR